jgi:hypothetical protein
MFHSLEHPDAVNVGRLLFFELKAASTAPLQFGFVNDYPRLLYKPPMNCMVIHEVHWT